MDKPIFITRQETSVLMRISLSSVDNLIKKRKLKAYQPSGKKKGRVLIKRDEALQLMESQRMYVKPRKGESGAASRI